VRHSRHGLGQPWSAYFASPPGRSLQCGNPGVSARARASTGLPRGLRPLAANAESFAGDSESAGPPSWPASRRPESCGKGCRSPSRPAATRGTVRAALCAPRPTSAAPAALALGLGRSLQRAVPALAAGCAGPSSGPGVRIRARRRRAGLIVRTGAQREVRASALCPSRPAACAAGPATSPIANASRAATAGLRAGVGACVRGAAHATAVALHSLQA
jgi:hypothetical protein